MTDKEIIDAQFEQVSPADRAFILRKARESGMTEEDLRRIFTDAGDPNFLPGGRFFRPHA